MAVPFTFATAVAAIPLSQLDANFATPITLGNTVIALGNTAVTLDGLTLTNLTLSGAVSNASFTNITITSVASTFPNAFLAHSTVTLGTSTLTLGAATTTVTGLRLTPRVTALAIGSGGGGTITILTDSSDSCDITGAGGGGTTTIAASGTPTTDQLLRVALVTTTSTNGIAWSASFEASTLSLPVTVTTTRQDLLFIWNAVTSKWRLITKA